MPMKFRLFLAVGGILVFQVLIPFCAASSEPTKFQAEPVKDEKPSKIEDVELKVNWEGEEPGKLIVEEVESAVVKTVKLAILTQLSGSLETLEKNLPQITDTLDRVISIVLQKRGIQLKKIRIIPGKLTRVELTLSVLPKKINEFKVVVRFKRSTAFLDYLSAKDTERIRDALLDELAGSPYTDLSWLQKLVNSIADSELASMRAYADFRTLILVVPGETTVVYITFLPKENAKLIAQFYLKIRSETLLNLQLERVETTASTALSDLIGMPISFAKAKKILIEKYLTETALNESSIRFIQPIASSQIFIVRDEISAVLYVDSRTYRLKLSGRVDLNKKDKPARFDFTAGRRLGGSSDVFFHLTFFPSAPEVRPQLGVSLLRQPTFVLESAYDFKLNSVMFRGYLHVLPDFYLSAEHYTERKLRRENEYALTYIFRNLYEFKIITDFKGEVFGAIGVRI